MAVTEIFDNLGDLERVCAGYENALLVCDVNTEKLADVRFARNKFVFPDERLEPDEYAAGRLFIAAEGADFIIGLGSGVINDVCRYVSFRQNIPYAIIATAASMDGYLSNVSPLIAGGTKKTFIARPARAAVLTPEIYSTAPFNMTAAGLGDILGKITSTADWRLSRELTGEDYSEVAAQASLSAAKLCLDAKKLTAETVMTALTVCGKAMSEYGSSRPASGTEHLMAHYFEYDFIKRGEVSPLHGALVGVSALVVTRLIEMLAEDGVGVDVPDYAVIEGALKAAGAAVTPKELGIGRELFGKCIAEAKDFRDRFSFLRLAHERGKLAEYVEKLTNLYYGEK